MGAERWKMGGRRRGEQKAGDFFSLIILSNWVNGVKRSQTAVFNSELLMTNMKEAQDQLTWTELLFSFYTFTQHRSSSWRRAVQSEQQSELPSVRLTSYVCFGIASEAGNERSLHGYWLTSRGLYRGVSGCLTDGVHNWLTVWMRRHRQSSKTSETTKNDQFNTVTAAESRSKSNSEDVA